MIELQLTDHNIKEFEQTTNEQMQKPIKHFEHELITIRTGRAHPSLVEDIKVTCYGDSVMKIKELATITTPEPRLITIQPWDKTVLGDIEQAILGSDAGVTPINDGTLIRITLPEMTAERRDELVKILHKKLEESRIAIRNIRKEFHNLIRNSKKDKTISEDHSNRLEDTLQKITNNFVKKVEEMSQKKEKGLKGF